MLLPIVIMISRPKRLGGGVVASIGRNPPNDNVYQITKSYYGVVWKGLYGYRRGIGLARSQQPYAYFESDPYCPKCDYKMEEVYAGKLRKSWHWKCDRCGSLYKCPDNDKYAYNKVERLIESDIRTGRITLSDSTENS